MLDEIIAAGVGTIAISIDGLENTHDYIRKKGSYQKIINALKLLKARKAYVGAITTINKLNISELGDLKEVLVANGVDIWQLQFALPMGNFSTSRDLAIEPEQINDIIDFAYDVYKEGKIEIHLADCLGYYNLKEVEIRQYSIKDRNYDSEISGLYVCSRKI